LNDQQKNKTKQWVDELHNILVERPASKSYNTLNNTQTLKRNKEMSVNLLKTL